MVTDTQPAAALLRRLGELGVTVALEGEALRVGAPKGVVDEALRAELKAHKAALIALLGSTAAGPAGPAQASGPSPASAAQRRLWFLDRLDPGNPNYNIAGAVRVTGPLDITALTAAIELLVDRHEALRSRLIEREGALWLDFCETARSRFRTVDLSAMAPEDLEAAALKLANEHARTGFDLATGPLSSLLLIQLASERHLIVGSIHHIVSDGWSVNLLVAELLQAYRANLAGAPAALPTLPGRASDQAQWEREMATSGAFAESLAFWKHELAGAPPLIDLPSDFARPATRVPLGGRLIRRLDPALLAAVRTRAKQANATAFAAIMTCFQALLHRYTGQDDIVVGTPLLNRDQAGLENVVGCLINNVVIRGRMGDEPRFLDLLDQIKARTIAAQSHGQVPFDLVVEHLNPRRSASHAPIFQVLLSYMVFPQGDGTIPGLEQLKPERVELEPFASRYDLSVEFSSESTGGGLRAQYEFPLDMFKDATIDRFHHHFEQLLGAFAADAGKSIGGVRLDLAAEERAVLAAPEATPVESDERLGVHQIVAARAARDGEAVAIVATDRTLSYGELDRAANRLAGLLHERGVGPGDRVAFCLDRCADLPVAMTAILRTGAAYVPLDPTHPAERLRYVVDDAGAACIVTLRRLALIFADSGATLLLLDEAGEALDAMSDEAFAVPVGADDLAYVIYTSGSTGRPKGVEITHRNLTAFLGAMAHQPGLASDDVLLAVTTPAFDIAGLEMWLPLVRGARVVIAAVADCIDGARLLALIAARGVTVLQATPATWRLILAAGGTGLERVKALCGGEALPPELAARLLDRVGELWNMYGPTETTIWSTTCRIHQGDERISIGRPIAGTFVRVLDGSDRQTPIGVAGELCIGGAGVARGYRNRSQLTAEKFVTLDPLGEGPERLYRTGDLVRLGSDGALEFLGRRDFQVKLRGYRIELGEIEAVLAARADVEACAVVVREDIPGDQRLVAYVASPPGERFESAPARAELRAKLPEYMVPGAFVALDALPLTANAKIDRTRLPRPPEPLRAGVATLMSPPQRRVAAAWREVLTLDTIGLDDNFFDLGGHSLLLTRLHACLQAEFGGDMPLVELFQHTTVAAQAERLSRGNAASAASDPLARARQRFERKRHL